jgi:thiol-disulfide isomerase/thioredoxin
VNAQGITFEKKLSWAEIQKKAKAENKYIFLDIYATWCVPCKKMDSEVYTDVQLSEVVNKKFIAVKVQFDQTPDDDAQIKKWYDDVKVILAQYHIDVVPTYLFFSPEGKLIKKRKGFQEVSVFMNIINETIDPNTLKFYTELENYKQGKKNYNEMLSLIYKVEEIVSDQKLEQKIAKDYKSNYLDNLSIDKIFKKDYLDFISHYPQYVNSNDNYFKIIKLYPYKVDSIMKQKGWSDQVMRSVIVREEVLSKLYTDKSFKKTVSKEPNWESIDSTISVKYGKQYIDMIIPHKIYFYQNRNEWRKFAMFVDQKIKQYPPRVEAKSSDPHSTFGYNVNAWDVFLYCKDSIVLKRALNWVNLAIEAQGEAPNDQYIDTKANILYKLGRVEQAIKTEESAIERGRQHLRIIDSTREYNATQYQDVINKMRKGTPTWLVPGSTEVKN